MLKNAYEELKNDRNTRENLSLLRSEIQDREARQNLIALVGEGEVLAGLLDHEEPKVRKNAALLIGDLGLVQAAGSLFCAYEKETTLFVRSAYLSALGRLDPTPYLDALKARRQYLISYDAAENEKKHVGEELREIEKITAAMEGITRHVFEGFDQSREILLATNREQRQVTLSEVEELSAGISRRVSLHPLGVLVQTGDVLPFTKLRTYRELLFPIHVKGGIEKEPKAAAAAIWNSDMPGAVFAAHNFAGPFYFRLELKSRLLLDKKSRFAKQFAAELEHLSKRKFVNSTADYELEIRLIEKREGGFVAFYKLSTIPMKRFSYRKHAIAASIHPASAAMLIKLAKPYLKADAQILDPFCGVGTMLIERDICVPAREKYGIDIFGDAVCMARENAARAGEKINFINRDYFDFRHTYPFDEIITNMPTRGKKTKEEMDAFYAAFFEKSGRLLTPGGMIIMYSGEEGFVKKQLRLFPEYRLVREYLIREKDHMSLFIIQYR